jgi:hypothetical protein
MLLICFIDDVMIYGCLYGIDVTGHNTVHDTGHDAIHDTVHDGVNEGIH